MQGNKRETSGWQLLQVTKPYMIETFTRVARFERWNDRAQDWTVKNCPGWVAETYLARAGRWKIPVLLSGRLLFVTFEVGGRGSRTILRGLRLHLRRGGFESIDPRCGGRER